MARDIEINARIEQTTDRNALTAVLAEILRDDRAVSRLQSLLARPGRRMLGMAGAPAAGKSTLAEELVRALNEHGLARAVLLPMDGFHLADAELARLGLAHRKGAPDTFDAGGYRALLDRIRAATTATAATTEGAEPRDSATAPAGGVIYAPMFHRELEAAVAGEIAVRPEHDFIVTEGNYLLLDEGDWKGVRERLDEVWYVEIDESLRRARLQARHERFGRTPDAARAWIETSDEPNARRIEASRNRAVLILRGV